MPFAACRDADPEAFFPNVGKYNEARSAIEICKTCDVRAACDIYATENKIKSGVWGGRLRQARGQAR